MINSDLLNPLADFAGQTVAFTGTAGSVAGWPAGPEGVLVWASTAAYIAVGEGATATTSGTPVPANTPVRFKVPKGSGGLWRVSAIQVSTGGSVYCKPINRE